MLHREGAANLLDESPQQHQQLILRIPDDLEVVAGRVSVAKLEGIEGDAGPEQAGAEVELVEFSGAIGEPHWFKLGMFESRLPGPLLC